MNYRELFIFVEGENDERFINSVIVPLLQKRYQYVKLIKYARMHSDKIDKFIATLKKQRSSDYLFISDLDSPANETICVTKRKKQLLKTYRNLDIVSIQIVKEEIESWYYAGISQEMRQKYRLKSISDTEKLNKEQFEKLMPASFSYKNNFFIEILNNFSIHSAKKNNQSFYYFFTRKLNPTN